MIHAFALREPQNDRPTLVHPLLTDANTDPEPTGAKDFIEHAPVLTRFGSSSEGYAMLVRRRFRRSTMGMIDLVLVVLLLVVTVFADFFAPMDPKVANLPFSPPNVIAFENPAGNFSLIPYVYPIGDTGELDVITFQPLIGLEKANSTPTGFFVTGADYHLL